VEQPTGRRLTADQRRKQLLDAVSTLAADPDVEALSFEEFAAQAGVSEGLLHHYFPSKQVLVLAAARRAAGVLIEDLRVAAAIDGPRAPSCRRAVRLSRSCPSPAGGLADRIAGPHCCFRLSAARWKP
jgi:AcrR family transcriptional regulator